MIDIKILRENPTLITDSLTKRGSDIQIQPILDLDAQRRDVIFEVEKLKKERNDNSALIGKGKVEAEEKQALILKTREIGDTIKAKDAELRELDEKIQNQLLVIPNILDADTPIGNSEEDNPVIRTWGEPTKLDFEPKHHADLAEALDILDAPRGVKLAQSRFTLVKGLGARIERALINFMLETHTEENGYEEVSPPLLVNKQSMIGTGQLPKFEEDLFKTTDGLYLIPSAEVPVTNIFAGEIVAEASLPYYFTSYTPCFRSEAGSYGKDTKGYIRQHQFNKVELVKLTHPDTSHEEHEKLLLNAEGILQALELPYRVVRLCSGDIGFSAQKCYDIEVWLPSEGKYREISSCSNCGDFQARRASIKFKPTEGGKPQFVHTLNGSGLAVGRTLVAILENYQNADGTVDIPKVLQNRMGGLTKITPKSYK